MVWGLVCVKVAEGHSFIKIITETERETTTLNDEICRFS